MDIFQIKQSVIAINFDWMKAIEMPVENFRKALSNKGLFSSTANSDIR
jgi:hypothetical protein